MLGGFNMLENIMEVSEEEEENDDLSSDWDGSGGDIPEVCVCKSSETQATAPLHDDPISSASFESASSDHASRYHPKKKASMALFKQISEPTAETMIWVEPKETTRDRSSEQSKRRFKMPRLWKRIIMRSTSPREREAANDNAPLLSSKASSTATRQQVKSECCREKSTKQQQPKTSRGGAIFQTRFLVGSNKQPSSGSFASAIGRNQ